MNPMIRFLPIELHIYTCLQKFQYHETVACGNKLFQTGQTKQISKTGTIGFLSYVFGKKSH